MSLELQPAHQDRIRSLHEQFFILVWITFKRVIHRLQRYGITHPQFTTLMALVNHGQPVTMRQLTAVNFQDPPTMTGIVNRLLKMKLVCRTRSESDRRVVFVEATPQGITLINTIKQDLRDNKLRGICQFNNEELTRFEELLNYFLDTELQQDHNPQGFDSAQLQNWFHSFSTDPIGTLSQPDHPEILDLQPPLP